jgi:phage/plasmid-like protein (TIGR03299 family)
MFSGSNTTPWHGLGTVVSGLLNSRDAIAAAGLDWTVEKRNLTTSDGMLLPDWVATVRTDTKAPLGVVSTDDYKIVQNVEAFDFFDSVIKSKSAVYDTAGSLRGGKRVWIMAKLSGDFFIGKDAHERFALLVTSHDRSYSLMMQLITTRVVCQNTLSVALGRATNQIKIAHRGDIRSKESAAREALGIANNYFAGMKEVIERLSSQIMLNRQMTRLTEVLIPSHTEDKVASTRALTIRKDIEELFWRGAGNKGINRYDALNAVTDYVDHSRTVRKTGNRLESSILGSGARIKQRAHRPADGRRGNAGVDRGPGRSRKRFQRVTG